MVYRFANSTTRSNMTVKLPDIIYIRHPLAQSVAI